MRLRKGTRVAQNGDIDGKGGWIVPALGNFFGQPIVLLHGFMQNETTWDLAAEAMASDYYLSMPRMAVTGPQDATLEAMADRVYGVVQQAILHTGATRVALVGYSMGGRVALEYARRYPHTLSVLVLESAGLGPEDDDDRARMQRLNLGLAERIRAAKSMEQVVDYWQSLPLFETQMKLSEEARAQLRSMRLTRDKDELVLLVEHAGSHTMPPAEQTRQMLKGLGIPVLYVAGTRDQKYSDVACSLGAYGVQPVLLDCGHNIHLEKPSEFALVVTGFIEHSAAALN